MAPGINIKMVLFFPYSIVYGRKETNRLLSIDIVMFFQAAPEN
jgi:hypothetical protein